MIPILYDKNEIAFVSNGLGRLVDCVSCEVTEERNGVYECEFVYPMTGRFYQEMVDNGGIISVIHDDAKDRQAFDIYKYSAPIDGLVTFNARHISYRLSGIPVRPFTAASCALALQGIKDNSIMPNPFTFWTDKVVSSTFTLDVPASARALLAGQQGSILDVYGKGEYKYNNFDVRLYVNRGVDSGVEIRYGKNLSNMTRENDKGDLYDSIAPYWKGESGVVTVPGYIVTAAGQTAQKCVPMDFSGEFSEEPTATQLQAAAENYLAENEPWAAFDNITVDFVQLWETEDYKDVAVLERCSLCDTVSIYFPALGVTNTHAKIIKVTYDVLRERYSSMELGSPQTTLSQAVLAPYKEAIDSIDEKASVSFLESAIQAATDLITGGLGGHVVIGRNADGEPNEILIMDTDDKATAVNVWRFNVNGLAHSHNGYNGPYSDIALTTDGKINADMITTGTLNAALATIINLSADSIYGGTLTVGGMNNANGVIQIKNADNVYVGYIDNDCYQLINPSLGTMAARLGMYQNTYDAYLFLYNRNGIMTAQLDGAYGRLYLRNPNGANTVYLDAEYANIRVGDGTRDRIVLYGTTGAIFLYDANGTSQVQLTPNGHSQFLKPIDTYGGLNANNGLTADNATVTGVLDVTQRRCYAVLSRAGWKRALTINTDGRGGWGFVIDINITRAYDNGNNEVHSVKLQGIWDNFAFVDESSKTNYFEITKIRYTKDTENTGHIDIYYVWTGSGTNAVAVDFAVHTYTTRQANFVAESLQYVADSPSGETVMTEYTFAANTAGAASLNAVTSHGTITSGEAVYAGRMIHLNFIFTASVTATNSPQIAGVPNALYDTALSAIDITSGIASAITAAIPCGVSTLGRIYLQSITSGHIYAITGDYLV